MPTPFPFLFDSGRERVTISEYEENKLDIRVGSIDMIDDGEARRLIVTYATARELVTGLQRVLAARDDVDRY
jgi:hypothetical protein